MIFSRGRGGRHSHDERSNRPAPSPHETGGDGPAAAGRGPYDVTEAPDGVQRLDLGSLRIPAVSDVEVRVQANPDGVIQQVVLVHGDNALQLGAFAAPRTEGIWDEVRQEIRESLIAEGASAAESEGEYGVELRARVRTPDGVTDLRFVGVDGPRWMIRGVYQGAAATDPAAAGPLAECLHGLVVDRGQEAKPVREPLPLRLPREVAEQADRNQAATGGAPAAPRLNGVGSGAQIPRLGGPSPHPRDPA